MNSSILLIVLYSLLVIIAGLLSYWFLRMVMYRRDLVSEQSEVSKEQVKALNEAHAVAKKIIDQAEFQSIEISKMREEFGIMYKKELAKIVNEVIKNELNELSKQAKNVRENYMSVIKEEYDEYAKVLGEGKIEIKDKIDIFLVEYKKEIHDITHELVSELRSYSVTAKNKIDQDMAVYRQNLIKDVEERVETSVEEISVKILGQSLSNENHEELVRKAIEAASKDGVFN